MDTLLVKVAVTAVFELYTLHHSEASMIAHRFHWIFIFFFKNCTFPPALPIKAQNILFWLLKSRTGRQWQVQAQICFLKFKEIGTDAIQKLNVLRQRFKYRKLVSLIQIQTIYSLGLCMEWYICACMSEGLYLGQNPRVQNQKLESAHWLTVLIFWFLIFSSFLDEESPPKICWSLSSNCHCCHFSNIGVLILIRRQHIFFFYSLWQSASGCFFFLAATEGLKNSSYKTNQVSHISELPVHKGKLTVPGS